ncbi:MAG: hypothetical protein SGILL_009367 [Bacillariaceae sp.]
MQKGKAVVDFGVGRPVRGIGQVKVLGSLEYRDAVEIASDEKGRDSANKRMNPWVEYDDEDKDDYAVSGTLDELYTFDDDDDDDEQLEDDDDDDESEALLALRKDDYVEDGEVEEDVSHLYEADENGNLMYKDPETGELTMLEDGDELIEDDDGDVNEIEDSLEDEEGEVDLDGAYEDIADEDMSNLVTVNEDGSLTYTDPETGDQMEVNKDDEEYDDMLQMKSLVDQYLPVNADSNTSDKPGAALSPQSHGRKPRLKRKFLNVGDYVNVYVLDVSKQSRQLRVTTNPLIQGQTPKEIKKEGSTNKRLARLRKQVGGLNNILTLKGNAVQGVVKAASNAGDWVYVQPLYERRSLPVGIGALNGEGLNDLAAGDYVQCQFDGIDEERGQLALKVLHKLDGPTKEIDVNEAVNKRTETDTADVMPESS